MGQGRIFILHPCSYTNVLVSSVHCADRAASFAFGIGGVNSYQAAGIDCSWLYRLVLLTLTLTTWSLDRRPAATSIGINRTNDRFFVVKEV